jgi:cystathionine gamma-synthase
MADGVYWGVQSFGEHHFSRWGGLVSRFDPTDAESLADRMTERTKIVWLETPSNPRLRIADIAALAHAVRTSDAKLLCDSTFSTPLLTRPFEHGADIVLHSATKYLGGHSDAMGGAVLFREPSELAGKTRTMQTDGGAVMDPFSAWLILRGMRSLGARMRMICSSAARVASWLEQHPDVQEVSYPGLASHPGHDIARRQMDGFGGMISFQVRGDAERARRVIANTRLFVRATSLGGTESLIDHRKTSEGPDSNTPENLLRLSIGLEHPDDLIDDLRTALDA